MRDLRNLKAPLLASAGLCSLVWQGDFATGQSTGSGVQSEAVANPCKLYGPVLTAGATDNGVPVPAARLGTVIEGDAGAEFVYGELVLASATDLLPGQVYQLDENFAATLLTTTDSLLNAEIVTLNVFAVQQAAGTYYGWFQRAGHAIVSAASGSIAHGQAETSATGGTVEFLTTHTAGTKSTDAMTAFGAASSITFKGNTTTGSPYITAVASQVSGAPSPIADLVPGMTITGTGLPSNACIAAIDKQGGQWRITIGTATSGNWNVNQNATATGTGVTFTVTSHVAASVNRPQLKTQN